MSRWIICCGLSVPALVLCILVGTLLGTGAFTVRYAEGFSYLSNDPKACVNCHIMRDQYDGWQKASHHAVASPLLNVARACQTCHRYPEEEIKARAEAIQARNKALMDRAEDALVDLLGALKAAKQGIVDARVMKEALALQRKAQWRVDFINAENSMGFHAPQESARVLGEAIDYARQGQIKVLGSR